MKYFIDFRDMFEKEELDEGRDIFEDGVIENYKQNGIIHTCIINDYDLHVVVVNKIYVDGLCDCGYANCCHLVALLYKINSDFTK